MTVDAPAGTVERLSPVFAPRSIAVVGASSNPASIGGRIYRNLQRDFPGRLHPVNGRHPEVCGDRSHADVADLPEPVDLVVVVVPAPDVPGVVERSVAAGHRGAYVLSAGFSESGSDEGRRWQDRLSTVSREHGFPVVGPNCIGFMNGHGSVMANFSLMHTADRPTPGAVALVSQSGGFGSYILNRAVMSRVEVGLFASTGNECGVTVADVLSYAVEQPELRVIGIFAEAVRDPRRFVAAARRALELDKVIVSVTPGSSDAVARAALSHTASVVGSGQVYDAVCAQYGILRAGSIDELVDTMLILQDGRRMRGPRLGVVTSSGGAGVLVAGAATDNGLDVPELSPATQRAIAGLIPAIGSPRNPVDLTTAMAQLPVENNFALYRTLVADDDIDAVLGLTWTGNEDLADALLASYRGQDKPVVPVITLDPEPLVSSGIPSFGDPTRAVRALAALHTVSVRDRELATAHEVAPDRLTRARELLARAEGRPFLLESDTKEILGLYRVPVSREVVCRDEDAAVAAAAELGRVALKVQSYDLPHKSDAGGLVLGLEDPDAVRAAFRRMTALGAAGVVVESVLVQEMVGSRLELALGLQRDPVFGPVVAVGLGGVLVEILGAPRLLHAPFTASRARAAVAGIAGGRITHPVRGLRDAHVELLAAAAVGLGELALELDEVASVDVNPMMVTEDGIVAVDGLLVAGKG